MPGIEEKENTWRYRVRDPGLFEDFRTKETNGGVSFVFGKYKGREEWAIQSIVFHKDKFPTKESVSKWLNDHTVKEKASGPIEDVKQASSYDLILAYEEAIDIQCQVGLSKYIPEMEVRGFSPDEGKKVLAQLQESEAAIDIEQDKRVVEYAIAKHPEGHKTKPDKYKSIPDSEFADPVNYKYPLTCEHVVAAWDFLHIDANRTAGGYSESEWSAMRGKAERAMKRCGHEIKTKDEEEGKDAKKPEVHLHLGDEVQQDPESVALNKEFLKNRVEITKKLLSQLEG